MRSSNVVEFECELRHIPKHVISRLCASVFLTETSYPIQAMADSSEASHLEITSIIIIYNRLADSLC